MTDWSDGLAEAIQEFQTKLPGWWFGLGNCALNSHASIGPDFNGPAEWLLKRIEADEFPDGFNADVPGFTPAQALRQVTSEAVSALDLLVQKTNGNP